MEIAEVALLRLVIIFLEDAPIVVLNLAQLLQMPPSTFMPPPATPPPPPVAPSGNIQDSVLHVSGGNHTGIAIYPPTTPLPGMYSVFGKSLCTFITVFF